MLDSDLKLKSRSEFDDIVTLSVRKGKFQFRDVYAQQMIVSGGDVIFHRNKEMSSSVKSERESILFRIPMENRKFICREENDKLNSFYKERGENSFLCRKLVLRGASGSGKTEVLRNYIYEHYNDYRAIFWFSAERIKYLERQYEEAYDKFSYLIDSKKEFVDDKVSAIKEYFNRTFQWLIIYDGIDYASVVSQCKAYLPEKGGDIIITSSYLDWTNSFETIDMHEKFSQKEALKFFEKNIITKSHPYFLDEIESSGKNKFRDEVQEFLENKLQMLPAAIAEMVSCLSNESRMLNFSEYRDVYISLFDDKELNKLFEEQEGKNDRRIIRMRPLAITIEVAIRFFTERDKKKGELLKNILICCSCLNHDTISKDLLVTFLEEDEESILTLLREMASHSLVSFNLKTGFLEIHKLRQDMLRYKYSQKLKKTIGSILNVIDFLLDKREKDFIHDLVFNLEFLDEIIRKNNIEGELYNKYLTVYNKISNLAPATYFSDLRKAINDDRLNIPIAGLQKLDQVKLMGIVPTKINNFFIVRNLRAEAQKNMGWKSLSKATSSIMYNRCDLSQRKRLLGHVNDAYSMISVYDSNNLDHILLRCAAGRLFRSVGDYYSALDLLETGQQDFIKFFNNDDQNEEDAAECQLSIITDLSIGVCYRELGKIEQSIQCLEKILKITRLKLSYQSKPHPILYDIQLELALSYRKSNKIEESKRCYREAALPYFSTYFQESHEFFSTGGCENYQYGLYFYSNFIINGYGFSNSVQQNYEGNLSLEDGKNKKSFFSSIGVDVFSKFLRNSSVWHYLTGYRYQKIPKYPVSFVSNFLDVFNNNHGLFELICRISKFTKTSQGGLCYFWISPTNCVVFLTNPEHIKQIFKDEKFGEDRNYSITRQKPLEIFGKVLGGKSNIFMASKDSAKQKRNKLKPRLFTGVNDLDSTMDNYVEKLLSELAFKDNDIDLKLLSIRFTMNLFAKTQLGLVNDEITEDEIERLSIGIYKALASASDARNFLPCGSEWLGLPNIEKIKEKTKKVFSRNFLEPHKMDIISNPGLIKDIVTELSIDLDENLIDYESIYSEACVMLIAGHETTSNLLQFILVLLSKNEEYVTQLRKEIQDNMMKIDGCSVLNASKVKVLKNIIRETLRLYPPAAIIARGVDSDFRLILSPGKTEILKKGDFILVSPYITHRIPVFYPNPNSFNPSRNDNNRNIGPNDKNGTYIPFGLGVRRCPGWKFVQQELSIFLVRLYSYYDVEIKSSAILNDGQIDLDYSGTIKIKGKVRMKIRARDTKINIDEVVYKESSDRAAGSNSITDFDKWQRAKEIAREEGSGISSILSSHSDVFTPVHDDQKLGDSDSVNIKKLRQRKMMKL